MPMRPHPGSKFLINSHRDDLIDSLVTGNLDVIDTYANRSQIDSSYLSAQFRLRLPFYPKEQLADINRSGLVTHILSRLASDLAEFERYHTKHVGLNGIRSISPGSWLSTAEGRLRFESGTTQLPCAFDDCSAEIGLEIQEKLHYIHKPRSDTAYHFGIRLEDKEHPLNYCAISICDRNYQAGALGTVMGIELKSGEVAVMTRAFGFNPQPKNTMSKLFDLAASRLAAERRAKYLITAINPFLGFRGSIFLGSSYVAYATSPMRYNYGSEGEYLNRRNRHAGFSPQKYTTPPIIWLARALCGGRFQKRLESLKYYYEITENEYDEDCLEGMEV